MAAWLAMSAGGIAQNGPELGPIGDGAMPCLIDASARLKVGAATPGLISKVLVDRGDSVQTGQVVAQLELGLETAQVELMRVRAANDTAAVQARNQREFLRRKVARLSQLRQTNIVTEAQYDETVTDLKSAEEKLRDAERNLDIAKLELERASAQLEQRIVRAPVDGVVVERALGPGEYRYDQAHILTIARVDPLYVEAFVPIALYGRTRVGARAEIMPEAPIGGRYGATVTVVDNVIDAASGTFGVRLTLPNPNGTVPAGLRCRVTFDALGPAPAPAQVPAH